LSRVVEPDACVSCRIGLAGRRLGLGVAAVAADREDAVFREVGESAYIAALGPSESLGPISVGVPIDDRNADAGVVIGGSGIPASRAACNAVRSVEEGDRVEVDREGDGPDGAGR